MEMLLAKIHGHSRHPLTTADHTSVEQLLSTSELPLQPLIVLEGKQTISVNQCSAKVQIGMCDYRGLRSACASTQSDQSLH